MVVLLGLSVFQAPSLAEFKKCASDLAAIHQGRTRSADLVKKAGLLWGSDKQKGYKRIPLADGTYAYHDLRPGKGDRRIADPNILSRIENLKIPPGWVRVWISPNPRTHIQATGLALTANGRLKKQRRYHRRWQQTTSDDKFQQLMEFGNQLGQMRAQAESNVSHGDAFSKQQVLGGIFLLLDEAAIRIGNEISYDQKTSYGITTLRKKHFVDRRRLVFTGKAGVSHDIKIQDPRTRRLMLQLLELPGWRLFKYRDAQGRIRHITADDVRTYLHNISGANFSPKVFRTWKATVTVAAELARLEKESPPTTLSQRKKIMANALAAAAKKLGNTPAVVRTDYIPKELIDYYLEEDKIAEFFSKSGQPPKGLSDNEHSTSRLLEHILGDE